MPLVIFRKSQYNRPIEPVTTGVPSIRGRRFKGERAWKRKNSISPRPFTTPSDKLHIGHTYCTVATDVLARYHRLLGEDVMFLTGTDEHGQKIEDKAREAGVTPQQYVDSIVTRPRGTGPVEADEHLQRPLHPHH